MVGVARYESEEKWDHRQPRGRADVKLFVTSDPTGDALLWHHLLTLDLIAQVHIDDRPADEVLPWLLVDARHARPSDRCDFLWIRPLDIAGLLAARTYLVEGELILEVVDASGGVGPRFALDGGPAGASCRPTQASPQLTIGISTLGSVYLGGYGLSTLAAAGLVDEHSHGAVVRADAMFRSPIAPWCSTWF